MSAIPTDRLRFRAPGDAAPFDAEVAELPLLLPERHLRELERIAHSQGLSAGELLRRIVGAFLHEPT